MDSISSISSGAGTGGGGGLHQDAGDRLNPWRTPGVLQGFWRGIA